MEDLPHDPTAGHTGFERELPDNSVEYLLFVIGDDTPESKDTLMQLEKLRRSALDLCQNIAKDYIWQRDEFKLELKNEGGKATSPLLHTAMILMLLRLSLPPRPNRIRRRRRRRVAHSLYSPHPHQLPP